MCVRVYCSAIEWTVLCILLASQQWRFPSEKSKINKTANIKCQNCCYLFLLKRKTRTGKKKQSFDQILTKSINLVTHQHLFVFCCECGLQIGTLCRSAPAYI